MASNVDLVLRVYPDADVDVAALVRDQDRWALWRASIAPLCTLGVESVWPRLPGGAKTFTGLDGMRAALLDWTAAWATYRTQVEEAIDCGKQVVRLAPSFGRLADSDQEIRLDGANAWTIRDRKVSRIYHSTRTDALKLFGLKG